MSTIIEGLLTVKPKNAPKVGQIKALVVEDKGNYVKLRNPKTKDGETGTNYRIIEANQTDYHDDYGNVSFNLKVEEASWQPAQTPPQTHQDTPQRVSDPILETRQHLMRACNLYNLCVDAVNSAIVPHLPEGARMSAEQLQSTLASIWIEASSRRSTNGQDWWSFIDKMPVVPIKKETKPKAQPHDDEDKPPF